MPETFSFEDATQPAASFSFEEAGSPAPAVTKEYASSNPTKEPQIGGHPNPNYHPERESQGVRQIAKGLDSLENPLYLLGNEGIPARLYHAYQKGTFNKPLGELIKDQVEDSVKDFSMKQLWDLAKERPGEFMGSLVNSIVADPELLMTPIALGGRIAKVMSFAGSAGRVAGRAIETGAVGGAIAAGGSIAQQLDEDGAVYPGQVMRDFKAGAAFGAAIGTAVHIGADIKGITPKEVYAKVQDQVAKGHDTVTAIDKALAALDIPAETRAPLISALEDKKAIDLQAKEHQAEVRAGDKQIEQMTKEFKSQLPPEVKEGGSPGAARTELGKWAAELQGKRKAAEALEGDFARMRQELLAQEQPSERPPMEDIGKVTADLRSGLPPEELLKKQTSGEAKKELGAWASQMKGQRQLTEATETDFKGMREKLAAAEQGRLDQEQAFTQANEKLTQQRQEASRIAAQIAVENLANPAKKPMTQGVIVGSAEAALTKPAFQRSADDIVALRRAQLAKEGAAKKIVLTSEARQKGFADPEFLKWTALGGLGAAAMSYLSDNKAEGAILGAMLAVGGLAALKGGAKVFDKLQNFLETKPIGPKDTRFRIDHFREPFQKVTAESALAAMKAETGFKRLVPEVSRRNDLTHFIQTGEAGLGPRTDQEALYVDRMKKAYEAILTREKAAGVIENGIEDGSYIAQFWEGSKEEIQKAQRVFSQMGTANQHAMQRVIPNYKVGMEKAGLKPKTLDSAEIFGMRLEHSGKTIARAQLFESLKSGLTPEGERLLVPRGEGSAGYVDIPHPVLTGYKVHPDIAPSIRLLYSAKTPNAILDGLETVASAMKRSTFSMSMFHPMSLTQAMLGMSRFFRTGPKAWKMLPEAHAAWMMKGNDELVRQAIVDGGVKIEPRKGVDIEYDLMQKALARGIEATTPWLSKGRAALAAGGAAVGLYQSGGDPKAALVGAAIGFGGGRKAMQIAKEVDKLSNKFLWDYLHPVFKIATFGAEYERAMATNTERAALGQLTKSPQVIAKEVGSAVNDIYGGLQWGQIAEGVQNRYGRDMALALAHPDMQRLLRLGFMAPDWLAATTRSVIKAIPGVSSKDVASIHRSYVLNSLLMYGVLADALNTHFAGHHFWENKDPLRVELGDGRTMQLNKHLMETFHMIQSPGKFFLGKLGPTVTEPLEQALHVEYLSPDKKMPPMGNRLGHLVEKMLPISGRQSSLEGAAMGAVGIPIYGKTDDEKAADRVLRKERARLRRLKQLEE